MVSRKADSKISFGKNRRNGKTGVLLGMPVLFSGHRDEKQLAFHQPWTMGWRYLLPNLSIDSLPHPPTFGLVDFSYYLY
ncbi:MAG: hypothetical protein RLZZ519_2813 [Bacteroidota bacterium]